MSSNTVTVISSDEINQTDQIKPSEPCNDQNNHNAARSSTIQVREEREKILFAIPTSDLFSARISFLVYGFTGTIGWSTVLNSTFSIFTTIYQSPSSADSILFGYFLLSMLVGIYRVKTGSMAPFYFALGVSTIGCSFILLPVTVCFIKGMSGIILVYFSCSLTGLGVGLMLSNSMAYGGMVPINLTGYVLAGNGFAGLAGFIIWQFLTIFFFDPTIESELKFAVVIAFSILFCSVLLCYYLFHKMNKKSWFRSAIDKYQETFKVSLTKAEIENYLKAKKNNSPNLKPLIGSRPPLALIKQANIALLMGNGAFFVTFFLFPNFGPYAWNGLSLNQISLAVGIHQLFDATGRFIPNIGKLFRLRFKTLVILSFLRLLFIPIFLTFTFVDVPFTNIYLIQIFIILIFAFTHGFVSSQALASVPTYVHTIAERGIVGICVNLHQQLFLSFSILLSTIAKIIFDLQRNV